MQYNYLKALHIVFIVTWFAGLFYMPRLFIYFTEAQDKPEGERKILQNQFLIMMRRLWFGITWPSALLTLGLGVSVIVRGGWWMSIVQGQASWLVVKIVFVLFLYGYHLSLQYILRKLERSVFLFSSNQLRIWNEVATIFLLAIVMLATVKDALSFVWGLAGLFVFIIFLLLGIRIYRRFRG